MKILFQQAGIFFGKFLGLIGVVVCGLSISNFFGWMTLDNIPVEQTREFFAQFGFSTFIIGLMTSATGSILKSYSLDPSFSILFREEPTVDIPYDMTPKQKRIRFLGIAAEGLSYGLLVLFAGNYFNPNSVVLGQSLDPYIKGYLGFPLLVITFIVWYTGRVLINSALRVNLWLPYQVCRSAGEK